MEANKKVTLTEAALEILEALHRKIEEGLDETDAAIMAVAIKMIRSAA